MKTCPVCGDVTFDDQPICFGCLHAYASDDVAEVETQGENVLEGFGLPGFENACPSEGVLSECAINGQEPSVGLVFGRKSDGGEAPPPDALLVQPASFLLSFSPMKDKSGRTVLSCAVEPWSG